jgi:hypothetical protein
MGTNNFADAVGAWLMALIQASILSSGENAGESHRVVTLGGMQYDRRLALRVKYTTQDEHILALRPGTSELNDRLAGMEAVELVLEEGPNGRVRMGRIARSYGRARRYG